jgi:hypothetical protein
MAKEKKPKQSDILFLAGFENDYFHDGDETYTVIPVGDHKEVWPVHSSGFTRWLIAQFFIQTGSAPNANSLTEAKRLFESKAFYESPEERAYIRIAGEKKGIYIDLVNSEWERIMVGRRGWHVTAKGPHFVRHKGMLPLPAPETGGGIEELRKFLNVEDDRSWILMVAWLLGAFNPTGPYPVLVLQGEQGSAKSTISHVLRSLVDPNLTPYRSKPRSEHDLVIMAGNSWVLAFDNLSGMKSWLSDGLCRISTGGGFSTRTLYSDRDETIFQHQRPIILNGIDEIVTRHDLADRAIFLSLPPIPDNKRIPEKAFYALLNEAKPRIMGALMDAASMALRNIDNVDVESLPRMADFALWVAAAEPALPWKEGYFLQAYEGNRVEIYDRAIDADMVATTIKGWMEQEGHATWTGTSSELFDQLEGHLTERETKRQEWPKSPSHLSRRLARCASFLRRVGVEVEFAREARRRVINLKFSQQKMQNAVIGVTTVIPEEKQTLFDDSKIADDGNYRHNDSNYDSNDGNHEVTVTENFEEFQQDDSNDGNDGKTQFLSAADGKDSKMQGPPRKCPYCGGTEFWRLNSERPWVCSTCHPPGWPKHKLEVVHVEQ